VQQGNPALAQRVSCWLAETPERDLDVMTRVRTREGLNEKAFGQKCPNRVVWTDIEWYRQGRRMDTASTHVGIALWLARFVARSLFSPRRADGSDGLCTKFTGELGAASYNTGGEKEGSRRVDG
jgi:hypothetical protein